jgi:hypothetical protein
MKKVKFTNKEKNESKVYLVGNVGQYVFACVNNVKETNDAIRWCNTHNVGDKFDCDAYTLEIIEG